MPKDIPQFTLTCINSKYPLHLIPGVRYKVDISQKDNKGEPAVFWMHPMENKWVYIGNWPLVCFDLVPIKKYIAKKKGIEYKEESKPEPVRQRPVETVRQRPVEIKRNRPEIIIRRRPS